MVAKMSPVYFLPKRSLHFAPRANMTVLVYFRHLLEELYDFDF